jgi:hypothetical protein
MPGKAIILLTLGMIIITGLMLTGILSASNNISKNMVSDYQRKVTYNIAQSGANIGIKKFRLDSLYTGDNYSMMGGKVNIRVKDTTLTYGATVKTVHAVISTGYTSSGTNQISYTSMAIPYPVYTLTWVKGAYTSNSFVVPSGSGEIDGREHDTSGTLIPGGFGTIGVWSTNQITLDGSVSIWGSSGGKDYPLPPGDKKGFSKQSDTNAVGYKLVIVDNQAPPAGGYPYTADDIMGGPASGFYPGTILNSAIYQGHYYPINSTIPDASKNPFSGVTYIDLNSKTVPANLDISGSGLIVLNNTDPNALYIPNLMGNFQGFVILANNTNIEIYKADIIGGLQTTSPKYTKSSLNAGSYIRYSSEAIKKALYVISAQKAAWFEKQNYLQ